MTASSASDNALKLDQLPLDVNGTLIMADDVSLLLSYAHTSAGTASQVIITPDINGDLTFSLPQSIATTSDPVFRDMQLRALYGTAAPTASSYGTGAGTTPTPVLSGTSLLFRLTLRTGTTCANLQPIATFAFNHAFSTAPIISILPASAKTNVVQATLLKACTITGLTVNGFVFTSGLTTPLDDATDYVWDFLISGH